LSSQSEALAKLAELQRVDQGLKENTEAVAAGERRVAELEEALQRQEAVTVAARASLAELTARQKALEERLASAETRMKDKRLRIPRIRNDKELGLAKREVELLKEETSQVETELVGVLEQVDAATKHLEAAEAALAELTTARDTEATELRETVSRLSSDIARDKARRDELVGAVDGELRRKYEMIFSRRGGVAVVAVRGGTCQGCHMHVPPQLFIQIQRNEQVLACPNCQRILYWQPEGDAANS
jgi:predicted  nucleic acid-binding Zn-ribbon protein